MTPHDTADPTTVMYPQEPLLLVRQEDPAGVGAHVEERVHTCSHYQQHRHSHLWDKKEGAGAKPQHLQLSPCCTLHSVLRAYAHALSSGANLHSTKRPPACPLQPFPRHPDT